MITQERLKELFDYDPETGNLIWKVNLRGRFAKIGKIAGGPHCNGYRNLCVDQYRVLVHRMVWLYHHGFIPPNEIDHINGIKADNRIENLRLATRTENLQNTKKARSKHTNLIGVGYCKRDNVFVSSIRADGKRIHLGTFKTAEEAHTAYVVKKKELHSFQTIT